MTTLDTAEEALETGGNGRGERRKATRRALLRAAHQLIGERGYRDTAVSDIVGAAGVSQGAFYLYFPSKLDIVLALMEIGSRRLQEAARRCVAAERDPARAVACFVYEITAYFRVNKGFLLVLFREVQEKPVIESRERHFAAVSEILATTMVRGIAEGQFRDDDTKLLALMLMETAFVLTYRFLLDADELSLNGIEDRIVNFCVTALGFTSFSRDQLAGSC